MNYPLHEGDSKPEVCRGVSEARKQKIRNQKWWGRDKEISLPTRLIKIF